MIYIAKLFDTYKSYLLPAVMLLVAFILRIEGITWGLPLKKAHIDESVVIFYTMRFFTGDLNPHIFFDYPTLFLYALGGVFFLYFIIGRAFGTFGSLDDFAGVYLNGDASMFYLLARLSSAVLGTLSVYLVYRIALENFFPPKEEEAPRWQAAAPALVLAVMPLHVLHSHYATVDVAAVFVLLMFFLYAGRYFRSGARKDLYSGAFILGLAAAVKYYPAFFFLPLALIVILKEKMRSIAPLMIGGILVAAGFVAGCPFSLLDFPAFMHRFADRFQLIIGTAGASSFNFNIVHPVTLTLSSMFMPLVVILAAGIIGAFFWAAKEDRKKLMLWLLFPASYFIFTGMWNIVSPHYMLPAVPLIALAGTYGLSKTPYFNRKEWLAPLAVAILCLYPAYRSLEADVILKQEDSRLTAYNWMRENLPVGARILRLPHTPEFTSDDPFLVRVDWEGNKLETPPGELAKTYDFIIISYFSASGRDRARKLDGYYEQLKEWPFVPLAPFHHPRITLYGKKT